MAHLGNTFDPGAVEADERQGLEPMPAGDYNVHIVDSVMKETKSGGDMLALTLEVIDGPYEGRKVFDNLNIRNANPVAQSIAHQTLKAICDACGTGPIEDSETLHHRPMVAVLKIEADKTGQYDPRNAVKRYKARGGAAPAGKAAPQRVAAPPQRAASGSQRATPGGAAPRPWAANRPAAPDLDDNIPF